MALKYLTYDNKLIKSPDGKLLQIDANDYPPIGTVTAQALEDLQAGDRVFVDTFDHIEDMDYEVPSLPASGILKAVNIEFNGHNMFFMIGASAPGVYLYELIDGVMIKYANGANVPIDASTQIMAPYTTAFGGYVRSGNLYFWFQYYVPGTPRRYYTKWLKVHFAESEDDAPLLELIYSSNNIDSVIGDHETDPDLVYAVTRKDIYTFNVTTGGLISTVASLPTSAPGGSYLYNIHGATQSLLDPDLFYITCGQNAGLYGEWEYELLFTTYDRRTKSFVELLYKQYVSSNVYHEYPRMSSVLIDGIEFPVIFAKYKTSSSDSAPKQYIVFKPNANFSGTANFDQFVCTNHIYSTTFNIDQIAVGHRRIIGWTLNTAATQLSVYELGYKPMYTGKYVDATYPDIERQVARKIYDSTAGGFSYYTMGLNKKYVLDGISNSPYFAVRKVVTGARKNSEGRSYDYVGFVKNNAAAGENVEIDVIFSQTGGMLE